MDTLQSRKEVPRGTETRLRDGAETISEMEEQDGKLTLRQANGEAMLPAEAENLPEVVHVGGEVLAEY